MQQHCQHSVWSSQKDFLSIQCMWYMQAALWSHSALYPDRWLTASYISSEESEPVNLVNKTLDVPERPGWNEGWGIRGHWCSTTITTSERAWDPRILQSTSQGVHVASLKSRRSHVRTRGRGLVPAQSAWTPRALRFEEVPLENTGIKPQTAKTMDI